MGRVVTALRQWLEERGGPPTPDSQLGPILWDRARHLDRWTQHTSRCATCLRVHPPTDPPFFQAYMIAVIDAFLASSLRPNPLFFLPTPLTPREHPCVRVRGVHGYMRARVRLLGVRARARACVPARKCVWA